MSNEILSQFLLPERLEKLETVLSNRTENITIVLDNILNYHNISAVIRTADAFGIMPPVSKLTPEQTKYYFLSGFTAKFWTKSGE